MPLLYRMHSLNFSLVLTPTWNSYFQQAYCICVLRRVIGVPARLDVFLNYNNTLNLALLVKFFNLQLPYSNDNCMKTTLRLFKFPAKKACQHHWRSSILKGEMRWRNHSKRCRSDYRDDLPWTLLRVYKFILASMYKVSNLRR